MRKIGNSYLIWLNWPIQSFCVNWQDTMFFQDLLSAELGPAARPSIDVVRSERAFLKALPRATHAIVWEFRKDWFPLAKRLRVLATPGAGRELLPTDAELPKGVVRINGTFHGQIMGETVVACLFAFARGLYPAYEWQREGTLWPRRELSPFCTRVAGTKAVILGYGHIGQAVGAKLEALGVSVTGIRRSNFGELKPALKDADWLIVALPGDTGTDNLVDADVLRAMKRSAVLVNVGRGNAIDEQALAKALKTRHLQAAFLDVFKKEPLTAESPLAENLPGLFRLPHATAFAPDYMRLFFRELAENGGLR